MDRLRARERERDNRRWYVDFIAHPTGAAPGRERPTANRTDSILSHLRLDRSEFARLNLAQIDANDDADDDDGEDDEICSRFRN